MCQALRSGRGFKDDATYSLSIHSHHAGSVSGVADREWAERRRREFGDRLRAIRLERGLSQEDLAHQADLHRTYVGSVERGDRNISLVNIYALADALEVTAADLFVEQSR